MAYSGTTTRTLKEISKKANMDESIESPNDELVIRIGEMLGKLEPSRSSKCCIYRVPHDVRQLNEQAYSPLVVSIGPFHHQGNERLRSMDELKKRYFKNLVERSETRLSKFVELVKGFEGRARECYAETIVMGSDDFVTMMLIDACFIIELLLRFDCPGLNEEDGHVLSMPWLIIISLDLIKLENQIPFFVLEEIFILAIVSIEVPSIQYLALQCFNATSMVNIGEINGVVNNRGSCFKSVNHFTNLILIQSRPNSKRRPRRGVDFESSYSATELNKAGVKFRGGKSKCLLDIDFNEDVLTIPCFDVDCNTGSVLRNLIALELCHYPNDTYIVDYIFFMDYLIDTSSDIDLLIQNGIILNWLGDSSAAANLFNNLCKNITIVVSEFYFSCICEDLNAYYRKPMHKWKATCKRDYFSTPWQTASTIAAFVLLVLTLIQTICSILSLITGLK